MTQRTTQRIPQRPLHLTLAALAFVPLTLAPDLPDPLGSEHAGVWSEDLATLIAEVSTETQIWLTTHSETLAEQVAAKAGVTPVRLYMENGETLVEGQGLLDRA